MSEEEKIRQKMKIISEIRPIKQAQEDSLLKKSGVTGVDIGYKYVNGKKTDEMAIRVYVDEKKDVPKNEMIPKTINGIKTDVIERKFVLHPLKVKLTDLKIMNDTVKYDPLKGGMSIGPCRTIYMTPPDVPTPGWYMFTGTLGCIVKDKANGKEMLLSNFHVMCVTDTWQVGDTMVQPSLADGGHCPADIVGELQRASLGGKVDCAVASHTARGYACEILDIGKVAGKGIATNGMAVRKRGRTTQLTYGTVDSVDLTVSIDYGDGLGVVTLKNQIGINVDTAKSAQFGISGDSGSVVVDNANKVIGLYFAGSTERRDAQGNVIEIEGLYGVANPIQDVLDALNIEICVPPTLPKPIFEPPESLEKIIKQGEKLEKGEKFQKSSEKDEKTAKLGERVEKVSKINTEKILKIDPEKLKVHELLKPPEGMKPDIPTKPGIPAIPDIPTQPRMPGMPSAAAAGETVEQRVASLEATVAELSHFILSVLRPDLNESALKYEDTSTT